MSRWRLTGCWCVGEVVGGKEACSKVQCGVSGARGLPVWKGLAGSQKGGCRASQLQEDWTGNLGSLCSTC